MHYLPTVNEVLWIFATHPVSHPKTSVWDDAPPKPFYQLKDHTFQRPTYKWTAASHCIRPVSSLCGVAQVEFIPAIYCPLDWVSGCSICQRTNFRRHSEILCQGEWITIRSGKAPCDAAGLVGLSLKCLYKASSHRIYLHHSTMQSTVRGECTYSPKCFI